MCGLTGFLGAARFPQKRPFCFLRRWWAVWRTAVPTERRHCAVAGQSNTRPLFWLTFPGFGEDVCRGDLCSGSTFCVR
jgi:hypothetical protein